QDDRPQTELQRESADHGAQPDRAPVAGQCDGDEEQSGHPAETPEQVDHRAHLTADREQGDVVRASVGVIRSEEPSCTTSTSPPATATGWWCWRAAGCAPRGR